MSDFDEMMKKVKKIEFAESVVVDSLEEYVNEVLLHFSEVMKVSGIKNSFVSDKSIVWDFIGIHEDSNNEEDLKKISDRLGFKVSEKDYIYEIALKLKNK